MYEQKIKEAVELLSDMQKEEETEWNDYENKTGVFTIDLTVPVLLMSFVFNFLFGGHLLRSKMEQVAARRESREGEKKEFEIIREMMDKEDEEKYDESNHLIQLTDLRGEIY